MRGEPGGGGPGGKPPPAEQAVLRVHVQPRASRDQIVGWKEGVLYIRLTAPPVEGAANRACIELLAACLKVKRQAVRLDFGEKSREKTFLVEGLDQVEAERRLREGI